MQLNDYVIYNVEGICKVSDIVHPDFAKDKEKQYFLLVPIVNQSAKVYVPVDMADSRCRRLISRDEAQELLSTIDRIEMAEIPDDKEREGIIKSALSEGDLKKIVSVIKNIQYRKAQRNLSGKKNTAVDEKYFKIADRNLCHELGFVLNKSEDEIRQIIIDAVK